MHQFLSKKLSDCRIGEDARTALRSDHLTARQTAPFYNRERVSLTIAQVSHPLGPYGKFHFEKSAIIEPSRRLPSQKKRVEAEKGFL